MSRLSQHTDSTPSVSRPNDTTTHQADRPHFGRHPRVTLLAGLGAAVAAALLWIRFAGADDDVAATPIATAVKDAAFLNVDHPGVLGFENGDCFLDPAVSIASGEEGLTSVECIGAQNQVYVFHTLADGPWNPSRIAQDAAEGCREPFEALWGTSPTSPYRFYPVLPTERSWNEEADRSAMCVVYHVDGTFTVDPVGAKQ